MNGTVDTKKSPKYLLNEFVRKSKLEDSNIEIVNRQNNSNIYITVIGKNSGDVIQVFKKDESGNVSFAGQKEAPARYYRTRTMKRAHAFMPSYTYFPGIEGDERDSVARIAHIARRGRWFNARKRVGKTSDVAKVRITKVINKNKISHEDALSIDERALSVAQTIAKESLDRNSETNNNMRKLFAEQRKALEDLGYGF